MADLLGNEPRPWPRWLVPVALVGLVTAGIVFTDRTPARPPTAAASPSPSPSPTPSRSASSLPDPGTAANGCGGDVTLPAFTPGPPPQGTRLRLLLGDRDLRVIDVDTLNATPLRTSPTPVTALARAGTQVVAVLQDRCSANGYGKGVVAAVDLRTGALSAREPGDELLPGTPLTVIDSDAERPSVVRTFGTRTSSPIPADWRLVGRKGSAYYVVVSPLASAGTGALSTVGVGDPATGQLVKEYGAGSDIAANETGLVWLAGGCDLGPCLLSATGNDGIATAQPLHGENAWGGALSPDGRWVAFRLTRKEGRLGGHPGPPNDVAVADLRTGALTVLPGLVLPAKSGLTLTWSADGWLAIGADLGTAPLVLLWREGMDRPGRVPLPPTRGGTTGPPSLLFLDQSR